MLEKKLGLLGISSAKESPQSKTIGLYQLSATVLGYGGGGGGCAGGGGGSCGSSGWGYEPPEGNMSDWQEPVVPKGQAGSCNPQVNLPAFDKYPTIASSNGKNSYNCLNVGNEETRDVDGYKHIIHRDLDGDESAVMHNLSKFEFDWLKFQRGIDRDLD